jgi:hypothetical protein
MLTGGFRNVDTMEKAIVAGDLDVVGIARPFTLYPDLPNRIFQNELNRLDVPIPKTGISFLDDSGFVDIKWHEIQIHKMGKGEKPNPKLSAYAVFGHHMRITIQNIIG